MHMSYDKSEVILLPREQRFSLLYAEHVHGIGHYGVSTTVSKIRLRFWIPKIHNTVSSIRHKCHLQEIGRKSKCTNHRTTSGRKTQAVPSMAQHSNRLIRTTEIRDQVTRRTIGKCCGVLFNCMSTRAVHIDLASDYSTEAFLLVLRRFASLRGYPAKLYSDNGPQLVSANEELRNMTKGWDMKKLEEFGVVEGLKWEFTPADAPWQNGISEALIKSVKRAITTAISQKIMIFSELQTVCFEVANLINERPIGRHLTTPEDGAFLCPNNILLGRASARIPSGPFEGDGHVTSFRVY